jgi:hypothetical protein
MAGGLNIRTVVHLLLQIVWLIPSWFSVINCLLGCLIDPTPTNQNMPTFMNHVKNDYLDSLVLKIADSLEITAGYIELQNSITSVL